MIQSNPDLAGQLHEMLTEFATQEQMPGLSVGIVKDNRVWFVGEYGTADLSTCTPVERSTLFHQASVSKTFVASAVMQLVERRQVDLDAPVSQYLPYFTIDDERYYRITVRQLLNHNSGMPDEDDYGWGRPEYDEQSLERYVRGLSDRKLLSDPGEKFAYSNIGFEIVGDLIAKVSGMSFEQYMRTYILEPAGMRSSSFLKQEVETQLSSPHVLGAANGYGVSVSDIFPYNRAHGPSSTLYTNAEDMCQCMLMHLNRGVAENGNEVLQPDSYDTMWKPHAATGFALVNAQVGLSWFIGEYNGQRILSHTGWDTGFLSNLFLLPESNIGIVVMTNCEYLWMDNVSYPIIDWMLGSNIKHIKRSAAHAIAAVAASAGVDEAVAEYQRMQMNEPDRYYTAEYQFIQIADAMKWRGHREDAVRILKSASIILPDSDAIRDKLQELQS
ncbi:beta-lactamase family protein [Paenibacillus sp. PR3]|uniref:Beta-lactamase family protein n=1 Tax=Paenibacillus terricola TaxID=2763503 RepID=A0ABR8MWX2_9BACL|nr:serine hydrolase domain-containing protein [Paenibacillus terricola]MBD3920388.1 beta-lactamase family protein [Paenibacillus terricola]